MARIVLRHLTSAIAALALVSAFATTSAAALGLSLRQFQTIERGLLIAVGSKPPKGLAAKNRAAFSGQTNEVTSLIAARTTQSKKPKGITTQNQGQAASKGHYLGLDHTLTNKGP